MINRFLTILTALAFLGFSISAVAAKPVRCDPWPECKGGDGGGGGESTFYGVTDMGGDMGGDMGVYGTDWETSNNGWIDWFQYSPAGTGFVDLGFFLEPKNGDKGGPFTGTRGANCFGANGGIESLVQGGFSQQNNGSALGWLWIDARTDDAKKSVRYMLVLEGLFANPRDWFPSGSNTLTMKTWDIKIEGGGKRVKNISCEGNGVFVDPVVVKIVKNP